MKKERAVFIDYMIYTALFNNMKCIQKEFVYEDAVYGYFQVDLKSMLERRNISRTKLSRLTQIKYDIINKYYKGRCKQIDLGTMAKICSILNCQIQDIVIYVSKIEEKE